MTGFRPKIILVAAAAIALIILISLAQEMNRRLQLQREVQRLENEAKEMHKNVIELENLNQYFRTDAYQERLAREKLNYAAPGEKVVLIPETIVNQTEERTATAAERTIPIPERWWRIFFVEGSVFQ